MAKKLYEQLGEELFNSSEEVSTKKINKADFDKSYKTTIVGCNRYFTDDVPEETQAELIKKYNIPEVSVSGVYYTFRINGNWYVKSSNNDFKLYEEVVVRVPNGNWDNMFIEVQRDTVGESGGTGVLSAVKIDGNKLFYNGEEYRLQFGNNKRIMCVTKGKLHHIVETEDVHGSYIEAATAVLNGLTNDCDIEFDANIFYPNNTYDISWLFDSSDDLTGVTVDWGDGTTTTYPDKEHIYGVQGMFRIKISGLPKSVASFDLGNITSFWNGIYKGDCSTGSHAFIGGNITTASRYSQDVTQLTWGESIKEVRDINYSGENIDGEFIEMSVPPCVNTIGQYGYGGQSNYVYIPPECTSIEYMAFYNVPLKDIEISPDGDTLVLGDYAFNQIASTFDGEYSCVTSLEIPVRVQIGQNSFYNMGTRIVKLERGTASIPSYALYCANFKRAMGVACSQNYNELYIFIPDTVTSIASNMFYGGTEQPRVVIVYEGSSSDWDKITKSPNWNAGNTNIKYIYGEEEYNSYPFCVREIKKFHELKSDDDGAYVAGSGISISDSIISVNVEDGLTFDHGALKVNAGTGIQCDARSKGKVSVIIGDGLEIITKEGSVLPEDVNGKVTLKKATKESLGGVKIGDGITITEDGTISAKGKDFTAGDGIEIADSTISVKPATSNTIGGIKAGKGLKVSSDGTLDVDGGGGSYTAGSGIEISEENAINLKQATSSELGGIILGEGLEYDPATGKTNTVPNIQQAVIISEADAKYLLHEYTQVEYIAGNKIGYAGAGNQIVAQGYITHRRSMMTTGNMNTIPDYQYYTDVTFQKPVFIEYGSVNYGIVRIYLRIKASYNTYDRYELVYVAEDGTELIANTYDAYNNYVSPVCKFAIGWEVIYPPGYTTAKNNYCEFGCAYGYPMILTSISNSSNHYTVAATAVQMYKPYMQFATEAEYNAAVGLTYEPQTLTNVEETITEV